MSRRAKMLLVLSSLILIVGATGFSPRTLVKNTWHSTAGSLEEKARKAKGGDEAAVRDLTDEVLNRYGQILPSEVRDEIKERVVRAEMEHKKNSKGGVREGNVVNAVNFLAERFNAPDYVKTDHRQVRVLRARWRPDAPSLIAPDPDNKKGLKKKLGEPMNPELSPLEATGLLLVMLSQKAVNDEFQQTPQEFAKRVHRKPAWMAESIREGVTLVPKNPRNAEKISEVMRAATEGMARMNTADAINLAGDTLDKLGLKK